MTVANGTTCRHNWLFWKQRSAQARQRVILCDLNWTRLFRVRLGLAQFFDHPASHHHFAAIDRVEIVHANGFRSTAILLVGWLAAQLHWRFQAKADKTDLTVLDKNGRTIQIKLSEEAGEPIGRISLLSKEVEFRVVHPPGKDLLEVSRGKPGVSCAHQVLPAGSPDSVHLLEDELVRGGSRKIYQNALQVIRELL